MAAARQAGGGATGGTACVTFPGMKWLVTYPEDGPSVAVYDAWIRAAGADPLWIAPDYAWPSSVAIADALLLPGGGDVEPASYGDTARHAATYDVLPQRDALEILLIREFISRRRPVLGICRGIQILNVALGGALVQHVPDLVAPDAERHSREKSYDSTHGITFDPTTRLGAALASAPNVNSAHHQALRLDRVAAPLRIAARSPAGIIEAVEGDLHGCRLSAVQWHPERLPADHPASAALRTHWGELCRRG